MNNPITTEYISQWSEIKTIGASMYTLRRSFTGKTWIIEDSKYQPIALFYSEELANKFLEMVNQQ